MLNRLFLLSLWLLTLSTFVASPSTARSEPWARHVIDNSSRGADGVRLADINGDQRLDIATGWEEGGITRVYFQPTPDKVTKPWTAVTIGLARSVEDAVFADLNGDGAIDVVSCCEGEAREVLLHFAPVADHHRFDPRRWARRSLPVTKGRQWMYAMPMQVDGKHGVDLIVGSKGFGASVSWLQSPEDPTDADAWRLHTLQQAGCIMSLESADMDGDRDLDVVVSDRTGQRRGVYWIENPGTEGIARGESWQRHAVGDRGLEMMFLTLADLDADGLQDIIATTRNDGLIFFRREDASGRKWSRHPIALPSGVGVGKAVAAGDIDGDGQLDLVFSCGKAVAGRSGVRWLSYREKPTDR